MTTYLDLETFSTTDLKKAGSYKYAENSEILICATKESDSDPEVLFNGYPTDCTISVYNAGFEAPVLNDTSLKFRDVQHKAASHGLPLSLDKAGVALGCQKIRLKTKKANVLSPNFANLANPVKGAPKKPTQKIGIYLLITVDRMLSPLRPLMKHCQI